MDNDQPSKKQRVDSLIDPSVLGLMRPHQIAAANFILDRLLSVSEDSFPLTGAVLADEMGTGKVGDLIRCLSPHFAV